MPLPIIVTLYGERCGARVCIGTEEEVIDSIRLCYMAHRLRYAYDTTSHGKKRWIFLIAHNKSNVYRAVYYNQ